MPRLHALPGGPCSGRLLAATLVAAAALGPAPAPARTSASTLGPVQVPAHELEGLGLRDVIGGELRLVHREEGARLEFGSLRLDPSRRPALRTTAWRLPAAEPCALLTAFERSSTNRLGGSFATWSRAPAVARAELTELDGERFLRFEYDRPDEGWGGLRIDLFDDEPSDRILRYLDARDREALTVRVRGDVENVTVGLADESWRERGDTVDIGDLSGFVSGPADPRGWRVARIPLNAPALDAGRLARVTLVPTRGAGHVDLDEAMICVAGGRRPDPRRNTAGREPAERSLWVWSTREVAGTEGGAQQLAAFAHRARIGRVYLQLPGIFLDPEREFGPAADPHALRPLLRTLRVAGIEPWALDGAPAYALPRHHEGVIETVRRLRSWNDAGGAEAAFGGLHLDIEPYLLPEWKSERDTVVAAFLTLFDRLQREARAADLPLEAAIPFWFDGVPAPTAENGTPVARSVFEGLADRVDAVVVMDYRTTAHGSNGLLALAETELELASARGRKVMVALETGALPDETRLRFRGRGNPGLPPEPGDWVVAVTGPDPQLWLVEIGGDLPAEVRAHPGEVLHWRVAQRLELPAALQTFYGGRPESLLALLAESERALERYSAFAGFALHHYEPLRRLLEGEASAR